MLCFIKFLMTVCLLLSICPYCFPIFSLQTSQISVTYANIHSKVPLKKTVVIITNQLRPANHVRLVFLSILSCFCNYMYTSAIIPLIHCTTSIHFFLLNKHHSFDSAVELCSPRRIIQFPFVIVFMLIQYPVASLSCVSQKYFPLTSL